jgi:predicted RNA-binding Zn-ribbon protein involved in translation (DUF1610 family)
MASRNYLKMTPEHLTPQEPPYLIQARAHYQCPYCAQPIKSVFQPPQTTSNWLLFTIALLLTPFLIGIIFWIVYYQESKREASTTYWHCESCGWHAATMPAPGARRRYQIPPPQPRPKRTFKEWLRANVLVTVVLSVVFVTSMALIGAAFLARPAKLVIAPTVQGTFEQAKPTSSKPASSRRKTRR